MPYIKGHLTNPEAACYEEIDGENYIEHDWAPASIGSWNVVCRECGIFGREIKATSANDLLDQYRTLFQED